MLIFFFLDGCWIDKHHFWRQNFSQTFLPSHHIYDFLKLETKTSCESVLFWNFNGNSKIAWKAHNRYILFAKYKSKGQSTLYSWYFLDWRPMLPNGRKMVKTTKAKDIISIKVNSWWCWWAQSPVKFHRKKQVKIGRRKSRSKMQMNKKANCWWCRWAQGPKLISRTAGHTTEPVRKCIVTFIKIFFIIILLLELACPFVRNSWYVREA